MTQLVVIDYGSGNLRSAAKACERAMTDFGINGTVQVTRQPEALASASHIILPGVGAFADCMTGLKAVDGLLEALEEYVQQRGTWFLGICVGMQLLFDAGYEHGNHAGLGWIGGEVRPLSQTNAQLKIPHMGWNRLEMHQPAHPLFAGISPEAYAYFVHSFHAVGMAEDDIISSCEYGQRVVAAVGNGPIFGTQFHPEKSQATGLRMLGNFLKM